MPRLFSSPAIAFIDVLPSARMASITGRMLAAYASAFTLSRAIPSGAAPAPDQRAPLRRVRPRDWDGRDGAGGADHRRDNRGDCRPCRRSVRAFRHSGPPLSSGANPVVTFPITGGSTSSTGDLIEHNGSGLRVTGTNPTTTVDIQIYLVDTGKELVDADSSIDGALQGNIGLFTLGSSGLSNVPLTLTSNAVTALNAAFGLSGMDAFTTSTPIGTLTSSADRWIRGRRARAGHDHGGRRGIGCPGGGFVAGPARLADPRARTGRAVASPEAGLCGSCRCRCNSYLTAGAFMSIPALMGRKPRLSAARTIASPVPISAAR